MIKLNVKRKLGRCLIDVGIQEIENVEFARQLVEKGLIQNVSDLYGLQQTQLACL